MIQLATVYIDSIDFIKICNLLENRKFKIDNNPLYYSKLQIDFSDDNVFINWNFFLGKTIKSKKETLKLERIWNDVTENFLLGLSSVDLHNTVKYICANEEELYELFFTNDLVKILLNSYTFKNELIETRKETNQELIKVEMEVNDFKVDNEYLVRILNENDDEIKNLNEEISNLKKEIISSKKNYDLEYENMILRNDVALSAKKLEKYENEIIELTKQNCELLFEIESKNKSCSCFGCFRCFRPFF